MALQSGGSVEATRALKTVEALQTSGSVEATRFSEIGLLTELLTALVGPE